MRAQVIAHELEQLNKIVQQEYTLEEGKQEPVMPKHTLIIVNKRVRQRFFQMGQGQNNISNPPQGTYVDKGFVEKLEDVDGTFDFLLVPHSVTQGAVKPTHFYIAVNTSEISKDAILNFTYALCYYYYNWADSINIPAPCMLARKVAIYRSEIGNIPNDVNLHKLPFFL